MQIHELMRAFHIQAEASPLSLMANEMGLLPQSAKDFDRDKRFSIVLVRQIN